MLLALSMQAAGPFTDHRQAGVARVGVENESIPRQDGPMPGENARLISSSLAVFLGAFGAHRLYLGTTPKVAVAYGVTFGGFGILAMLDLGHLLFTKDLDPYRNNDRVFMWGKTKAREDPIPQ
jgi:TM2 domain-containing membrane protein YozV